MQRGMQRMNQNQKPGGRRSRTGVLAANLLWAVAAGLAAAVGATLVGMLILAALVVWAALSDTALGALNQALKLIAVCLGAGCGGWLLVRRQGENGLALGALVGFLFFGMLAAAAALNGSRDVSGLLAAKLVSLLLSGALGGYVGLLQSERKRRRRAKAK